MIDFSERNRIMNILSERYGQNVWLRDSNLLRLYATLKAMYDTGINQPERAYETVLAQYSMYQFGPIFNNGTLSPVFFYDVWPGISKLSYLDFLTYVVPGIACDPKRTLAIFQKNKPAFGCIEQTHHILQIKLVAEKMKKQKSKDKNGIDQLYSAYLEQEKYHILEKEVFAKLYLSINAFEMRTAELSPKHQGAGFTVNQLTELMDTLTNKLQMTRMQQMDMIAEYFVKKQQARQIINNQQLYNFTVCKDEKTRVQLATKALRLITKIPPMESICAISIQKKSEGRTNTKRRTEAQILPNDITLEIGLIYPVFRQLVGVQKDVEVLLVYPSAHFVRKLWEDETLRDRNITLVMQNENVASVLQYQANDRTYAFGFPSTRIMGPKAFDEQVKNKNLPYGKILFFGNHLQVENQQSEIGDILGAITFGCEVYALLSTYAIEDRSSLKGSAIQHYAKYLHAISIIPQGINNGAFPRRKLWCRFVKSDSVPETAVTRVYAYELNTDLQTQVLLLSKEPPIEILRSDFATMESSIRKMYNKEVLLRNATGRTRTLPFVHEITPDIPVWCSRTFPKGEDGNPRLEAYVCLPPSDGDAYRGFSERGTIIQSTKKHTTGVARSGVLNWLENEYPISYIQPRCSRTEREQPDTEQEMKPVVSVREEIIENYLPLLEKENIALKTLWYLYPDLRNVYTGSDYNMLSSMMKTVIGQQRVCDITSELCEKLLMEVYPELNEAALWRNYTILSIAMEKAVRCGYCKFNPLADALYEEKLRRKLFAQVRKQLVKKHLNKNQIKKAYASVVAKLQSGQHAYLGVLLRFLTGLESNIVCALRWGDIHYFEDVDQMSFAITRQVSNDGKKLSGFSDKEDYMLFPLSDGLRDLLFVYRQRLNVVSEQEFILSSAMRLCTEGAFVDITPTVLNGYVKEILTELNIEDHIIDIAYGENEFRKTNLNKYMGDLMRENFRYWATKEAKLSPDELRILTKLRKSFSITEELRMLRWFCSLDPETATGEEIALAMMYFLGLRDNEACGASFSSFELMKTHPDMAIFTMGNTTSIGSNQLKASGKTSNAPRQLPVCMPLFQFIKDRKAAVQRKLNEDKSELPKGVNSVSMLPVVCRGQQYTCRSDTQYVSKAGRKLFKQIGITDSEIKWLYDILLSEDFQDKVIEEKDPTPYMLRRNVATRLYHSGLSTEDTRYWIAHDIESVHIRRNYYADEENLYELGKAYLSHPLFTILDAMLNDAADANEEPGGMVRFRLDADKSVIVEVEAREPNMPVYIAAKSEAPFSLVQTVKETDKSPESLVSIDYVLRNAYWRAYIQMWQNDDNSKEGQ